MFAFIKDTIRARFYCPTYSSPEQPTTEAESEVLQQAQAGCHDPPPFGLIKLPTETLLHIAEFLDDEALLALSRTSQRLSQRIPLTPNHVARVHKARYLANLARPALPSHPSERPDGNDDGYFAFCTSCHEMRPLASFSASEVVAVKRNQNADCLRHAQFWVCPHRSYAFCRVVQESMFSFSQKMEVEKSTGFPQCGDIQCELKFRHEKTISWDFSSSEDRYHIKSIISVTSFVHTDGPNAVRDAILHRMTKSRVQEKLQALPAPVCDHYWLSDEKVCEKYDAGDLDVLDIKWHPLNSLYFYYRRPARASDDLCSYCEAAGAYTRFRFYAIIYACDYATYKTRQPDAARIKLCLLVERSLGENPDPTASIAERPDAHLRCHGMTEKRLARFRDAYDDKNDKGGMAAFNE